MFAIVMYSSFQSKLRRVVLRKCGPAFDMQQCVLAEFCFGVVDLVFGRTALSLFLFHSYIIS